MKKAARFCLMLMLAVSLPFHAAYAVSMSQCTAMEQAADPMAPSGAAHGDHGSQDGHDHAKHAGSGAGHGDDGPSGGPHCGSCSACGTATAITGRALPAIFSGNYITLSSFPERRLHSVASGRLYRPPLAH